MIESNTTFKLVKQQELLNGKRKYYFNFFIQQEYYDVYTKGLQEIQQEEGNKGGGSPKKTY